MTSKILNNITKQIIDKYNPDKVILFGSLAYGKFDEDSDLDLLIIKDDVPDSGIKRRWQLRKMINKKDIPVDYLVVKKSELEERRKIGDPFVRTILSNGKVIYDKNNKNQNAE